MRSFALLCSVAAFAIPAASFAAEGDNVTSSPTKTAPASGSGTATSSNAITGTGATTGSGYYNGVGSGAGSTSVTGNSNSTTATGVGAAMDAQSAKVGGTTTTPSKMAGDMKKLELNNGLWVQGANWDMGTQVQVSKDGKSWMAAPDGTHTSKDGRTMVTTKNSMITEVKTM